MLLCYVPCLHMYHVCILPYVLKAMQIFNATLTFHLGTGLNRSVSSDVSLKLFCFILTVLVHWLVHFNKVFSEVILPSCAQ